MLLPRCSRKCRRRKPPAHARVVSAPVRVTHQLQRLAKPVYIKTVPLPCAHAACQLQKQKLRGSQSPPRKFCPGGEFFFISNILNLTLTLGVG